jgi:dTDP-4-amino-4,6-dideoxygalactose transaminase
MRVPFLDLAALHAEIARDLGEAFQRVVQSGRFILGPELEQFEQEFAAYCEARHCAGTSNGLDALHLILRAAGIGPGDEVLVPSNTFIATWLAVSYAGAAPVPVEPSPDTFNIDPRAAEAAISPRTRALIAVHLYGRPAEMAPLAQIASRHGLLLVEDAAQAHGARCDGRRTGGISDIAAFSFYPAKNIGALGDGGAVVTNDGQLADRVRRLRNYGSARRYHHDDRGFNARLDELQAAVLRVKLRRLDAWNRRRREAANRYIRLLPADRLVLPPADAGCESAWHLFVVRSRERDRLQAALQAKGVETLIHYPIPPHLSGAYREQFARARLPVAEALAAEVLSLPMGPTLTGEQVQFVASAVRDSLETAGAASG